jgi:ketosteroid isomerase-like protein
MQTADAIKMYYKSLNQKDNTWQDLWSADGIFSDAANVLHAEGKEAVIQSFTPFLKGVASVEVAKLLVDGNSACAIARYVYRNAKGETMNQDVAEVWEVKDAKLAKLTIYFDLTKYRAFITAK